MARSIDVPRDGYAAVVTAGPPGGGKSTKVDEDQHLKGWRRIDPDEFKSMLVVRAQGDPELADLLSTVLPDGATVMPMELCGLFHHESTLLADRALELSLREGENVIVEGTLSWDERPQDLSRQFSTAGYERVDVFLAEVPEAIALERALARWWEARRSGGPSGLGGRFTPAATITGIFSQAKAAGDATCCATHAKNLIGMLRSTGIASDLHT